MTLLWLLSPCVSLILFITNVAFVQFLSFMNSILKLVLQLVMHPSSAQLGSARIQLELEVFQLGSAREIFEPARLAKIGHIRAKNGSVLAMKRKSDLIQIKSNYVFLSHLKTSKKWNSEYAKDSYIQKKF